MLSEITALVKRTALYQFFITLIYLFSDLIYESTRLDLNLLDDFSSLVGISFSKYAFLILFSFVLAAGVYILRIESLSRSICRLIHYAVMLVAFIIIFAVSGMIAFDPVRILIFAILFTAAYFAILGLKLLFCRFLGTPASQKKDDKKTKQKETYRSMF